MTEKELAKYVLTHNLNEVIEICKIIINTDLIFIKDIPDISRKMLYHLQRYHYDKVTDLFDKEHIEKYGSWWNMQGCGEESLLPIFIYLYKNNLIKDENTINNSFFRLYNYYIHHYLRKNLKWLAEEKYMEWLDKTTIPEKINFDLSDKERFMALKLEDSKLPQRAKTILIRNNIKTIGELLNIPKNELRSFPQFGWRTFNDTIKSLKDNYGLELKYGFLMM